MNARWPTWCRPRRPHTLRGKLSAINAMILTLGLLLAGCASIAGTQLLLMSEVDESVRSEMAGLSGAEINSRALMGICSFAEGLTDRGDARLTESFGRQSFILLDAAGRPLPMCEMFTHTPAENADAYVRAIGDPVALADSGELASIEVAGEHHRVGVARLDDGALAVTSTRYDGVLKAVHKLLYLEAVIAVGLIALLILASRTAARRKLRPLEDMVKTASAISEGDLSRRVDTSRKGSREVEQLREALNVMLHQIEGAMRTREHATAQLRQFLADASHELRTPLSTIRGYLQLYRRRMLDDEEKERALTRSGEEAERMARLVDDLLALARLEARPVRDHRPVDLACLLRDAAADLAAQQPRRVVEVAADDPVTVTGDEAQLRQIAANLLANVRTHTPESAAVSLGVRVEDGGAVLRVADHGPGMREEDAARIFDRFFRADPDRMGVPPARAKPRARGRVAGGSGLGMAIVRAVAEAHDGTVTIDTAPGQGLTVTVRIPIAVRAFAERT
ncbi:Sensor histidine kinase RcsC [Streptomyces sp. RB5]|uniref:histidine kinase n=1 Tax=Streptomyces smaragdinus TaxID=2585196 RepID=A0A7K0CTR3_9ACTN|nr:HAMP domain-containing sensor histidine kinase [Streptomyces smaragdinus]MQY16392.1 Sensor histidine kinase RcsC [Streptomyces smaragdinus]